MSTPVNLNKVRKAHARLTAKKRADENAQAFGRTKAEKELAKAREADAARRLDGHKRDP